MLDLTATWEAMTEMEITPTVDVWIAKLRASLALDAPHSPAWEADTDRLEELLRVRERTLGPPPTEVRSEAG